MNSNEGSIRANLLEYHEPTQRPARGTISATNTPGQVMWPSASDVV